MDHSQEPKFCILFTYIIIYSDCLFFPSMPLFSQTSNSSNFDRERLRLLLIGQFGCSLL